MSHRPPCHASKNPAFLDPWNAPKRSIAAAVHMCREECHRLRECALEALEAGTALEGEEGTTPARDVLQAGVICDGTVRTVRALAPLAGVSAHKVWRPSTRRRRRVPPKECLACQRPMSPWTRGELPEGHVMHYARGFCVQCREPYKRALEAAEDRRITRTPQEARRAREVLGLPEPPTPRPPRVGRAVDALRRARERAEDAA